MPVTFEKKSSSSANAASRRGFSPVSIWKRSAVAALLFFALINLGLFRLDTVKRGNPADLWHGTGSIDLTVNEFKALKNKPDLVLLGSSLMMFPFWSMDVARDPSHVGDIFHHHGSARLEECMRQEGFLNPGVFSFAIFGQMVSDAFIYVNEYLRGEKTPQYLVYGVAPRDFSDADLSSPMSTNTFKRLVGLNNFAPYAQLYLPGFQDKADFVVGHLCYFYGHRWRLQQEFGKFVEKIYTVAGLSKPDAKMDFSNAGFMLFGGLNERWKSSEMEYARRYKNIAERDLGFQSGFLRRLLQVCHERGIKVVLINMPLSERNRKLLPPGFYTRFSSELAALADSPDVRLVDIGDSKDFTPDDFWDTAHLGPSGGEKVLRHLLPVLSELRKSH